jgi:hypothetical protein
MYICALKTKGKINVIKRDIRFMATGIISLKPSPSEWLQLNQIFSIIMAEAPPPPLQMAAPP